MAAHFLSKLDRRGSVLRLRKRFYSVKDAEKNWNKLLFIISSDCGPDGMNTAPCLFVGTYSVALCGVDDLVLSAAGEDSLDSLCHKPEKCFELKTLGNQNVS